ncbi:MAG: hypothetical protein J6T53_05130, partial [Bacteroidales bacterium]|nr:hypothetical protein [Bacteroidales bacterium]
FKELATSISVDCGCKSTPIFYSRNTFCKKFLKYFFDADYQCFVREISEDKAEIGLRNCVSKA